MFSWFFHIGWFRNNASNGIVNKKGLNRMNKKTHWKCPQCNSIIQGNNYHEITEEDLNRLSVIKIQARRFPSYSIFGGLESFDIGKRLYLIDGILYIENKEQYEKRIRLC